MRALCVLLVLVQLFVLTGDGRKPDSVFWMGTLRVPVDDPFSSIFATMSFWYMRTGEVREMLTVPADDRLVAAYGRTQERALNLGLTFEAPRLRQTKPELVPLLGPGIRYIYAMHYAGPRIILVNSWWTDQMNDAELEMLLAHEIVHAADNQNERRGNRYLNSFTSADDADVVADMLAALMFEPGEYEAFDKKFARNPER